MANCIKTLGAYYGRPTWFEKVFPSSRLSVLIQLAMLFQIRSDQEGLFKLVTLNCILNRIQE
jgi:hypothetical protein